MNRNNSKIITKWVSFLLVFSAFSFASPSALARGTSEKIDLNQEIATMEQAIASVDVTKNANALRILMPYLSLLKKFQTKLTSPQLCRLEETGFVSQPKIEISLKLKNQLFHSIQWLDRQRKNKAKIQHIFELFNYIEENKQSWRDQLKDNPQFKAPDFKSSDGELTCTIDLAGEKGKIKVSFPHNLLGEGAFKTAHEVIPYQTWMAIAKIQLTTPTNPDYIKQFKQESELNEKISQMPLTPEEDDSGLVKTLFVSDRTIFQEKFDMELKKLIEGPQSKILTDEQGLHLVYQLSNGLHLLHSKMKIVHGDIKPENILIRTIQDDPNAAWGDFGLSFLPEDLLKAGQKRPASGTPLYMAPEAFTGKWSGQDDEEKIRNAAKSDTFGLALMALYILEWNNYDKIIEECDETTEDPMKDYLDQIKDYLDCRSKEIQRYRQITHTKLELNSFRYLIERALIADPTRRISSTQFLAGMKYLNDYTDVSPPPSATKKELKTHLTLSAYRETVDDTTSLLKNQPIGTYFLRSQPIGPKQYQLVLCYKNEDGKTQEQLLPVNPKNLDHVQAQLEFLKTLGTITREL